MLKKVQLTNVHTGRKSTTVVDTGTDENALVGSGKTPVETAEVSDIKGIDETIQRLTTKSNSLDDRVALFNGLAKCFDRNIPIIACIMVTGTGGGYYLATHADQIIAHPTSIVGGIGVILNTYNMEDTMAQFNILSQPIKAGDKIDTGSPERTMEDDERELLEQMATSFHQRFIDQVKITRSPLNDEGDLFDGRVFTGVDAENNNLVDRVGYLEDAIAQARKLCGASGSSPVVMLRRDNDRAYTALDVTPNSAVGTALIPIKLPGLDRSSMPTFLYLWQADSSLAAVIQ